jgi:hypothetical protein
MKAIFSILILCVSGCVSPMSKVYLAAAEANEAVYMQMELALSEYHSDLEQYDLFRRQLAAKAFADRVKSDPSNVDAEIQTFLMANDHINNDAKVANDRFSISKENLGILKGVNGDLREFAVQSMKLDQGVSDFLMQSLQLQTERQTEIVKEIEPKSKRITRLENAIRTIR